MEAEISNNKLLYLSRDKSEAKYSSEPNGIIVATIKLTANKVR